MDPLQLMQMMQQMIQPLQSAINKYIETGADLNARLEELKGSILNEIDELKKKDVVHDQEIKDLTQKLSEVFSGVKTWERAMTELKSNSVINVNADWTTNLETST